MDADNHRHGRGQRRLSVEESLKLELLDAVRKELQTAYERLYIDHENLRSQHEQAVKNAKELEQKRSEIDDGTYRKKWRRFYEEEIALQELGATIRQYAEEVRKRRDDAAKARERLMKKSAQH